MMRAKITENAFDLRKARIRSGISLKELSEKSGLSSVRILALERARWASRRALSEVRICQEVIANNFSPKDALGPETSTTQNNSEEFSAKDLAHEHDGLNNRTCLRHFSIPVFLNLNDKNTLTFLSED
jgi:transcriptional regulator with XRE-family HTH domain